MGAGDGLTFGPTSATTPDDGLDFEGYPQPPEVPPDPTGENWRGPQGEPGEMGPPGPAGQDGAAGPQGATGAARPSRMAAGAASTVPAHKGQREPPGHKVRKATRVPQGQAAAARPAMRRRSRMARQRREPPRSTPAATMCIRPIPAAPQPRRWRTICRWPAEPCPVR